jgi:outer membrane protein OmpA-like peptidoglycan-associated protein
MSKALGLGVLVVGTGLLGWWAQGHHAGRIEHMIAGTAASAVAGSVHGAVAEVSGRDILLKGIVDGPEEEAKLLAALDEVPGRRIVTEDVTVLEKVTPFTLDVTKDAAGLTAKGFVPTEAVRGALGLGDKAAALVLAAGSPAGWGDLATKGIAALAAMNTGAVSVSDGALKISGEVNGPEDAALVDAALAGLPDGAVTKDIVVLDDGSPAAYVVDYAAGAGATASGKLPKGVDLAAIAQAMGISSVIGEVKQGLLGAAQDASGFAVFKAWMGKIETLKVSVGPDARKVEAGVQAGVDADGLKAALVGAGFDAAVSVVVPEGANGDKRVNAATGADERFMGGYWLAVPKFDLGLEGCQTSADGLLSANTINFVSGSDELDASAVAVINDLAGIMARCAEESGLRAEIGGHTDSSGDAAANLGLSQKRAVAVRRELIARGVAGDVLKSVGHGADMPIADNATEEGRAKNRRTTITWSK